MSKVSNCDSVKSQAIEYYRPDGPGGGVTEHMENILNSTFFEKPEDVYGHIANYFKQRSKPPKISKISAREVFDSRGQTALQTELYCAVLNKVKLASCSSLALSVSMSDSIKPEERELLELERLKSVERAVEIINETLSEKLSGIDLKDQAGVDAILLELISKMKEELELQNAETAQEEGQAETFRAESSVRTTESPAKGKPPKSPKVKSKAVAVLLPPDEPLEKLVSGCSAVAAASQAVCLGAASLHQIPLYNYLASLRFEEVPEKLQMPLPMVTVLASGRTAPGKLNCIKEFMVVPSPNMSLKEAVKGILKIYNHCAKSLTGKGGMGRQCNDWGALCPQFDRPEQGLDLLEDAIKQLGLTPGQDFSLVLNCAGHEILDHDKGKYEVTIGQSKTPDELVKFWIDLLNRYPSIIAIIDPMRKQEREQWMNLCEAVSHRCYVIGDMVFHRPGLLKDEVLSDDFKASAVTLRLEQMNTISDILTCLKKLEDAGHQIVISSLASDTTESMIADLAVGFAAKFIRIGGPCRGERVSKLNRLLQIEAELESNNRLLWGQDHVFPLIKTPTATTDCVEGAVLGTEQLKSNRLSGKEHSHSPQERKTPEIDQNRSPKEQKQSNKEKSPRERKHSDKK